MYSSVNKTFDTLFVRKYLLDVNTILYTPVVNIQQPIKRHIHTLWNADLSFSGFFDSFEDCEKHFDNLTDID